MSPKAWRTSVLSGRLRRKPGVPCAGGRMAGNVGGSPAAAECPADLPPSVWRQQRRGHTGRKDGGRLPPSWTAAVRPHAVGGKMLAW